jgi:hypothetical protein
MKRKTKMNISMIGKVLKEKARRPVTQKERMNVRMTTMMIKTGES